MTFKERKSNYQFFTDFIENKRERQENVGPTFDHIGTHVYRVHPKPQIFMIPVYRKDTLNKGLSRKRAIEHVATVSIATPPCIGC